MRHNGHLDLTEVYASKLRPTTKAVPHDAENLRLEDLPALELNLLAGDLPLPVAVLKDAALQHNISWMQEFTNRADASLCPHGKTTMAPQLFERQLAAGSWGMTAATAAHVRTYRQFGVQRIILANQLLGKSNVDLVLGELAEDPDFDFYCLIDSIEGLRELESAVSLADLGRPLQVLLEIGVDGGRTGVRSTEEAIGLGRAIRDAAPVVALRGVEGFEGIIAGNDPVCVEAEVAALLGKMAAIASLGCEEDWFAPGEVLLSAGGSSFFDLVVSVLGNAGIPRKTRLVLRSGCYVTHDSFYFAKQQPRMRERSDQIWGSDPGLRNALEVWAAVHSVPESHRAICGLGKRDVSHDIVLPQPLHWFRPGLHDSPVPVPGGVQVTALNDQHAYVDSTDEEIDWRPGDFVGFGVAHPCTTFDKWTLLYVVDDRYRVIDAVRTYF